jgi:type I restriction enzyme S subunit
MSLPRYPEYRDSGVTWFDKVPGHWELSVLKRCVLRVESGVSVNAVDEQASAGAIGVLKTSCVYSGRFDPNENKAVVPEDLERVACPVIGGTLIVSRMNTPALVGNAGFVADSAENLFLPDRLWQIHFSGALTKFAYYWTNSPSYRAQVEMACAGTSSSMQNLSQDQFLRFCLPLPSKAEQAAIAAFLDRETAKIDALVAEQQKLVALLKEKRQALISHAVTKGLDPNVPMKDSGVEWLGEVPAHWELSVLKRCVLRVESGVSVNAVDEQACAGAIGVLKTSCVYSGRFDPNENKAVVPEDLERVACPVIGGTLIVSRMNTPALVGNAGFVADSAENIFLPDRLWQIHFSGTLTKFAYYWTNSPSYRAQVEMACAGASSSMQNLSQDEFLRFCLPLPSKTEQTAIAAFLDRETAKIDALVAEGARAISLLQERRTALISAAVTGQIEVRGLVPSREEV